MHPAGLPLVLAGEMFLLAAMMLLGLRRKGPALPPMEDGPALIRSYRRSLITSSKVGPVVCYGLAVVWLGMALSMVAVMRHEQGARLALAGGMAVVTGTAGVLLLLSANTVPRRLEQVDAVLRAEAGQLE